MTVDAREQAIRDGQAAERLLADEMFQRVLQQVEENFTKAWLLADDFEKRELCHSRVRALEDIRSELRVLADRGTHAQVTLRDMQ